MVGSCFHCEYLNSHILKWSRFSFGGGRGVLVAICMITVCKVSDSLLLVQCNDTAWPLFYHSVFVPPRTVYISATPAPFLMLRLSHIRITNTPFMLLPSHRPCQTHQHPFHVTAQSPALSESPTPLSSYCPVTSPVRITNTPFILLPSHQPCQNHQHPFPTTAVTSPVRQQPRPAPTLVHRCSRFRQWATVLPHSECMSMHTTLAVGCHSKLTSQQSIAFWAFPLCSQVWVGSFGGTYWGMFCVGGIFGGT